MGNLNGPLESTGTEVRVKEHRLIGIDYFLVCVRCFACLSNIHVYEETTRKRLSIQSGKRPRLYIVYL